MSPFAGKRRCVGGTRIGSVPVPTAPTGAVTGPGYAHCVASRSMALTFDRDAVSHGEVLDRQVELLRAAHRDGDPAAAAVLRGTGSRGSAEEVLGTELTLQ